MLHYCGNNTQADVAVDRLAAVSSGSQHFLCVHCLKLSSPPLPPPLHTHTHHQPSHPPRQALSDDGLVSYFTRGDSALALLFLKEVLRTQLRVNLAAPQLVCLRDCTAVALLQTFPTDRVRRQSMLNFIAITVMRRVAVTSAG